jgi:hypothetical protein
MMRSLLIGILVLAGTLWQAQAQLAITEVMARSARSLNAPDYWELTNFGTNAINLEGYNFFDNGRRGTPNPFSGLVIEPGESIVFVHFEPQANTIITNETTFREWWGADKLPANLRIRSYERPAFNSGWDQVWLYDAEGNLVDMVEINAAVTARSFVYDSQTGHFGAVSVKGAGCAFEASLSRDVGSPGCTTGPVPLSVMEQPVNPVVNAGEDVTLEIVAAGLPRPRYQWKWNEAILAGQTGSRLTLTNVQPAQAGAYQVVLSNGIEIIESAPIQLTVLAIPSCPRIVQAPEDRTVFAGQSAEFSVSATGYPPPDYQWHENGSVIPGATDRTLRVTIPSGTAPGTRIYTVQVSNSACSTNVSATLTVARRPLLAITEIMAAPALPLEEDQIAGSDWFELTNQDTEPVQLQRYRFADSSEPTAFQRAFTITNSLVIQPGESIVFVDSMSPEEFTRWWGPDNLPPGLQIRTFKGFSFSKNGEELNLWNAAATHPFDTVASVSFASSLVGISLECDGESFCEIDSVPGVRGAFRAAGADDIGSPGYTANPPPRFLEIRRDETGVTLKCRTSEGAAYRLSYKTALSNPAWIPVGTFNATNSIVFTVDPGAGTDGTRFYRLEEVP